MTAVGRAGRFLGLGLLGVVVVLGSWGCGRLADPVVTEPSPLPPGTALLAARFTTPERPTCAFSAPLPVTSAGEQQILTVTADGVFSALDPATGAEAWSVALSAPAGLAPHLVAPPAATGSKVVFAWQDIAPDWTRAAHHVGVLDLDSRALDPAFAPLTLGAELPAAGGAGVVDFLPAHAYARSAVVVAHPPGHDLGLAYVSTGNVRDLQPWHGWMFEVDLDAWRAQGAASAISGTLVTTATPNDQCGAEDGDGARQMLCGGGIWAHRGPELVADDASPDGYTLYVPLGNGLLDPLNGQLANGVLRVGRGLVADPACDPALCAGYDPTAPADACAQSCANLFIPRLAPGQAPPTGTANACVGKTLLECFAALDWDIGANSPVVVAVPDGPRVVIQPGKDGALYLFDADHLGTMYDRLALMPACGEGGASCSADWAGTIVNKPVAATVEGRLLALVPTFVYDDVHPAGLQAVEVAMQDDGQPHLVPRWQVPSPSAPDSLTTFRRHAGGVAVGQVGGELYAAVVDVGAAGASGTLYWIRVRDGALIQRLVLDGPGHRFAPPLLTADAVYVTSCFETGQPSYDEGPSVLQAFTIAPPL